MSIRFDVAAWEYDIGAVTETGKVEGLETITRLLVLLSFYMYVDQKQELGRDIYNCILPQGYKGTASWLPDFLQYFPISIYGSGSVCLVLHMPSHHNQSSQCPQPAQTGMCRRYPRPLANITSMVMRGYFCRMSFKTK